MTRSGLQPDQARASNRPGQPTSCQSGRARSPSPSPRVHLRLPFFGEAALALLVGPFGSEAADDRLAFSVQTKLARIPRDLEFAGASRFDPLSRRAGKRLAGQVRRASQ